MRATAAAHLALRAAVAGLFASMLAAALHDVSRAWDVWYYHLPFAARLAGIVPRDAFVFHASNEARFEGFPLLAERLQGLLWRVTGRAESANLVAFAGVPLYALFLKRRFGVPMHLTALALLAIPLVQLHATSCYVDLPANLALSTLLLSAYAAHAKREAPTRGALGVALGAAAIAANMRLQLQPLVLAGLAALAVAAARYAAPAAPRRRCSLAAIGAALPIVFAAPLVNLVRHGNPTWPVRLALPGITFPGPESPYADAPPWLASSPAPLRWAASVLELGIRPMTDPRRWTVDQWMAPDSTGNRLGGFFGAYAVALLVVLVVVVARSRTRAARAAGAGFAALTIAAACMPQSHELRYYMVWMITLASAVLVLVAGWDGPRDARPRLALAVLCASALAVVLAVTRAGYVTPSGSTFAEVVREQTDERVLSGIADGERVCLSRAPWELLWAAPFHPPRRYTLKEAEDPAECAGYRPLDADTSP